MAITFDASSQGGGSGNTQTISHTCSGDNRLLIVTCSLNGTVSGVTYNGVSMTKINDLTNNRYSTMYYLIAPATGTHDIVVTCSNSGLYSWVSGLSFNGCKQSGVIGPNTTGTSTSINLTTGSNNSWIVDHFYTENVGSLTPGANQTSRVKFADGAANFGFNSTRATTTPGTFTNTASGGSSNNRYLIVEILELDNTLQNVFLTSGTSWTVPANWNNSYNYIEVIGGGANGANATADAGVGGGGGAYSKIINLSLTPGNSVSYVVGGVGQDTYFNGANFAASSVGAKGASGQNGGASSSGIGTIKYSGGNGGNGGGSYFSYGTGGGGAGAAGPSGNGNNGGAGQTGSNAYPGGTGGSGDAGYGGAGGNGSNIRNGSNGTEFSASYGCGGGGSGGDWNDDTTGGNGGHYGAGGGGGRSNNYSGGSGYQGLIVITYSPISTSTNFLNFF